MPRKDMKRSRPKYNPALLQELFEELEHHSYFELKKHDQRTVDALAQSVGIAIDAWSFVLHPAVIEALQPPPDELTRYIFTVDTLRSRIYFRVKEFLARQTMNVNSYFSGGWADFICDAHFTEVGRKDFFSSLKDALREADAARFSPDNDVGKLISIFRVEDSLTLCGRTLSSFGSPSYEVLREIVDERVKFEITYRNYRSPEALNFFDGNTKKLVRYLNHLREERVILCYNVVCDYPRFVDTEYVPLCQATKVMDTIIKVGQGKKELWGPIVDLLKVRPEQVTDNAENDVTHIFVNEYRLPGDRQKWKALLYDAGGDEINLYTYPLEGTLNESPIFLSDLPEVLARSRPYAAVTAARISIGTLLHPLQTTNPPALFLPVEGLSTHGITLGAPGTGKTNTDLVLVAGVARNVQTVVMVDATGGVAGKLGLLKSESSRPIERFSIPADSDMTRLDEVVKTVLSGEGIFLIEPDRSALPRVVDAIFGAIEDSSDKTTGNRAREISSFLLIEEANDAWGSADADRRERLRALEALLNKAWRKGWCIWLSTQSPEHLGFDLSSSERVLNLLKNRIIHNIESNHVRMEILHKVWMSEGLSPADLQYIEANLKEMPPWSAIIQGMSREAGKARELRPVLVKIRALGSSITEN